MKIGNGKKSVDLRAYARGQECQIRGPSCVDRDNDEYEPQTDTVVLCHWDGGGMGTKQPDIAAAWGCCECHRWVGGGYLSNHPDEPRQMRLAHLEGIVRTIIELYRQGILED